MESWFGIPSSQRREERLAVDRWIRIPRKKKATKSFLFPMRWVSWKNSSKLARGIVAVGVVE